MRNLLVVLMMSLLSLPTTTWAFSDGSGWKIVAQLTSLLKSANEQLDKMKENLDVQKRLEQMEIAKEVKKTNSLSDDLHDLFEEMDRTIEHFDYDPTQSLDETRRDLDRLSARYESISSETDTLKKLKGYNRLLKSIENLGILQQHHFDQMRLISEEGMNQEEAINQSAYSTSIATQLLIEQQLRQQNQALIQEKNATKDAIYLKNIGGVYGALKE